MDTKGLDATELRSIWLCRAPLLFAAVVITLITCFNLWRLLSAPAPRSPWESIQILEGWRSLQGLPVYEQSPGGHATHMYGALVPWVQGQVFGLIGVNNVSGRAIQVISAILLVTMLVLALRNGAPAWSVFVSWALILGVNHRSGNYFAENRPDMSALFWGSAALLAIGYGFERRGGLWIMIGTVLLVVGFFLKQTVTAFSIIPLIVVVMRWRRPSTWELVCAALPPAVMAAVILALKAVSPAAYHYMIEVPAHYAINWPRAVKFLWEMLLDSPFFLLVFAEWLVSTRRTDRDDARLRWLLAVLLVALPSCAVARAKVGGWPNSSLPALLAMAAFCALRLPTLLARLDQTAAPWRQRAAYSAFVAVLVLMTTFPHLTYAQNLIIAKSEWDREYWQTVAIASTLPGKVVCPEDPTIPLYAKRYVGQNLFAEKDARPDHGQWPKAMPEPVLAELNQADYVVHLEDYWGENLDADLLEAAGFEPAETIGGDLEYYAIWRRAPLGVPAKSPRTALRKRRVESSEN
jgi:hypothetical protein